MNRLTDEQIDDMINQANLGSLDWNKKHEHSQIFDLIATLSALPKKRLPVPDLARTRRVILDRIALPYQTEVNRAGFWASARHVFPRVIKISATALASLMLVLSATLATAVAALESVPGQPIYPLKKMVENVQMTMAQTDEEKANLQIKFANNRLDEMEIILEKSKQGKVSEAQAQKVVADTLKNLEQTASVVTEQSKNQPQTVANLTKLITLNTKQTALLQAAKVETQGSVQIDLDPAIEASKLSQEKALENIERAGLKIEDIPINMDGSANADNTIIANGKITALSASSVTIGNAKFQLTTATKYVNITLADLKVDKSVKISGKIENSTTSALEIEAVEEQPTETDSETPTTPPSDTP